MRRNTRSPMTVRKCMFTQLHVRVFADGSALQRRGRAFITMPLHIGHTDSIAFGLWRINVFSDNSYGIAFKIILVSERNAEQNVGGQKRRAAHRKRWAPRCPSYKVWHCSYVSYETSSGQKRALPFRACSFGMMRPAAQGPSFILVQTASEDVAAGLERNSVSKKRRTSEGLLYPLPAEKVSASTAHPRSERVARKLVSGSVRTRGAGKKPWTGYVKTIATRLNFRIPPALRARITRFRATPGEVFRQQPRNHSPALWGAAKTVVVNANKYETVRARWGPEVPADRRITHLEYPF